MTKDLISVIVPVYNGEKYIAQALDSVLNHPYSPLEIIVINDGSTDGTENVLENFSGQISCIYQENFGPAAARNRGLSEATGEFVAFLDADDIWHPQKLKNLLTEFEKRKNLGVALGLIYKSQFDSFEEIDQDKIEKNLQFSLVLGCSLVKRSVFKKVGYFDEDLILGEDTDWFFRVRENNIPISVQRKNVLYYRLHENNLTKNKDIYRSSVLRVLKKAKDRKQSAEVSKMFALNKPSDMNELIEMWNTVEDS